MPSFLVILAFVSIVNSEIYDDNEQANALNALHFAYASYCDVWQLSSWECKWCDSSPQFEVYPAGVIQGDSLQAFIGYDPPSSRIVLSFRGTHNVEDWMYNLGKSIHVYVCITS